MNSLIPKENEVDDDVFPPRSTDIDIGPTISHPPLIPEELEEPEKTPPKATPPVEGNDFSAK